MHMKYRTQCKTCDSMKYPPAMKYPPDYIISNISFSRRCAIILNQTTFVNCVNARMPPAGDSWMSEAQSEHLTHLMRRGLRVMTRLEDPDRKNGESIPSKGQRSPGPLQSLRGSFTLLGPGSIYQSGPGDLWPLEGVLLTDMNPWVLNSLPGWGPVTRVTCQGNHDSLRLVPARAVACRA